MAITQNERIFDLAYGARMGVAEVANVLAIPVSTVIATLANLSLGPSSEVSAAAGAESSALGETAVLYGNVRQVALPSRLGRSNGDYMGLGSLKDEAPPGATTVQNVVAVPVRLGDIFSEVGVFTGETAGTTTGGVAALYEGKSAAPVLIQESPNRGSTAWVAHTMTWFKLKGTVEATEANCPNGFIYVMFAIVTSGAPTCWTVTAPEAKTNYKAGFQQKGTQGTREGPIGLSFTTAPASEGGEKAQAKLETTVTSKTIAPLVMLA